MTAHNDEPHTSSPALTPAPLVPIPSGREAREPVIIPMVLRRPLVIVAVVLGGLAGAWWWAVGVVEGDSDWPWFVVLGTVPIATSVLALKRATRRGYLTAGLVLSVTSVLFVGFGGPVCMPSAGAWLLASTVRDRRDEGGASAFVAGVLRSRRSA